MEINYKFPKLNIDWEKYKKYEFKTLDKFFPNLPKEVKFCKKCILNNQRPRMELDENGICSACNYVEKKLSGKFIDWEKREGELKELLDRHRSKTGSWDVLVPSSGGKDSGFVAHQLKQRYGMHPLCVTWGPFIPTDIGFQNLYNMIQFGFNTIMFWSDGIIHRKLSRVAFELLGDNFEPFTYGQKAFAFHMALKFKIPLIFYGENGEVEYGGSLKNVNKPYESPEEWTELYYKGTNVDTLLKEGVKMGIFTEEEIKSNNFDFYKAPPLEEIKKLGVQMHWYSYYYSWNNFKNVDYSKEHTGYESSPFRTEGSFTNDHSIDDQTDGIHWWLGFMKFGYNRVAKDASNGIRYGRMTREEAVGLSNKYNNEFPDRYFQNFLRYLDMTEDHFWEVANRYRSPNIWEKVDGRWMLKKEVSRVT